MKKYECPECGEELVETDIISLWKCPLCIVHIETDTIKLIEDMNVFTEKLKQQIHRMRCCENCASNKFDEDFLDHICDKPAHELHDCLINDLKHWRQS